MDMAPELRTRTQDTAQDLASKYARAKAMLREQIDSNQALRLALREEQRQRRTLADGLEAERAATAAAVRKVAELEELLTQQRAASLAARQVDAQTQAVPDQPGVPPSRQQGMQWADGTADVDVSATAATVAQQGDAEAAVEAARRQAQADAEAAVETAKRQAQADAEAAVEALKRQSQVAQQQLCAQMLAALRQLQCEAQDLAVQTKQVAQQQNGYGQQRNMVAT